MNLPPAYDDELFYSLVARFADRMGLYSVAAVSDLVFGIPRVRPIVEFPCRLDLLLPRLLPGSPYDAQSLLRNHSLTPYFTSFLTAERRRAAVDAVAQSKSVEAFGRLGINCLRNPLHLRFCDECWAEDVDQGREPYWRRSHQLPGTIVCANHKCWLREGVPIRGIETVGFVSPARMRDAQMPTRQLFATAAPWLHRKLSSESEDLLRLSAVNRSRDLSSAFFEMLRDKGWTHGRRIAATELLQHAREILGADVLAAIGVHHRSYNSPTHVDRRGESTAWLTACLRVHGSVSHPLPYLLWMIACQISVRQLVTFSDGPMFAVASAGPTGPCANPLCNLYDPPVPRPISTDGISTMVSIRCPACQFTYRQAPNCARPKGRRIVEFGPVWDRALGNACQDGTASIQDLEKAFGVNITTIRRRAVELGIWHARWAEETKIRYEEKVASKWSNKRPALSEKYRSRWLTLSARFPTMGRRALGRHDEVAYGFLREFDREWLNRQTPLVRRRSPLSSAPNTREAHDAELAVAIEQAADTIAASSELTRVTRTAIARALGRTHFRLDPNRMPLSASVLARRAESAAGFKCRISRRTLTPDEQTTQVPSSEPFRYIDQRTDDVVD